MRKELGKIANVSFGHGGYQDGEIGLFLTLEGKGWGCSTSISGGWSMTVKWSDHCKWTEKDRLDKYGLCLKQISELLNKAKVDDVSKLRGIPVEAVFDVNMLSTWRILEEVL